MCLSKAVVADWDTDLWIARHKPTFNKCGAILPRTEDKVPVIYITDEGLPNLCKEWSRISQGYYMSEHGPWKRSLNGKHSGM